MSEAVICPKCGRKRSLEMAVFVPCPGPYDRKSVKYPGCGDITYLSERRKQKLGKDLTNT